MPDPATNKLKDDLKGLNFLKDDQEISQLPPDEFKKIVAAKLQTIVNALADRIHDTIDDVPLSKLPLAYGILQDKLLTLQGEATVRTQKTITVSHQDFNQILDALPSKPKALTQETIQCHEDVQ